MKITGLLIALSLSLHSFALKLYSDSVRIFKTSDTAYYLGVYGVVLPSGPCTVADKSITISNDSIKVSICFLYGNSQSQTCDAYDTVYLGNLSNSNLTVQVCLASSDTFTNTCAAPYRTDTVSFYITATTINDIDIDNGWVFFNPESHHIIGSIKSFNAAVSVNIYSLSGTSIVSDRYLEPDHFDIDVSTLPAGIYFLQLSDERLRVVKKFVKY